MPNKASRLLAGAAVVGAGMLIRALAGKKQVGPQTEDRSAVDLPVDSAMETAEEDPGMATLGEVEAAIRKVEKIKVIFAHKGTGRDARSNWRGFTPYPYQKKLNDEYTVAVLLKQRLLPLYQNFGLDIIALYEDGAQAPGGTKLGTIRASYK